MLCRSNPRGDFRGGVGMVRRHGRGSTVRCRQPSAQHCGQCVDLAAVRVFAHRALADVGYEILVASDGQEALEVIEALDSPVDLVLTDVVMPRMKGPELAERLSTLSPETPVLFMCGYVDNKAVEEQFKDRPEALLRKPFGKNELCERVRSALDF